MNYDTYGIGYSAGYADGCRDQRIYQNRRYDEMVHIKDKALGILGDALEARVRELAEATAVNAALQASLDEANAKIEKLTNPNPVIPGTNYRVGDKVCLKNREFNSTIYTVLETKIDSVTGRPMVLLQKGPNAPFWDHSAGWFERVYA